VLLVLVIMLVEKSGSFKNNVNKNLGLINIPSIS
jgi:hypothetical protein